MLRRIAAAAAGEPCRMLLVYFGAMATALLQFVRHAPPAADVVQTPSEPLLYALIVVLMVPTLAFWAIDRLIGTSGKRGALTWYRAAVFALAAAVTLRELRLYFGPAAAAADALVDVHSVLLLLASACLIGALAWLAIRHQQTVAQGFLYMAPVGVVMCLVVLVQLAPPHPVPAGAAQEALTAGQDRPPAFVIVFDELSYDVLMRDGQIDAGAFPNIAALAGDGLWFDDARATYFHTRFALPELIQGVMPLTGAYNVRMYEQYELVAAMFRDSCGQLVTCRGAGHLARTEGGALTSRLLLRSVYEIAPEEVERTLSGPIGLLSDALDAPPEAAGELGIHTLSKLEFEQLMSDLDSGQADGRLYFYHSMLPHFPFIFDEHGNPAATDDGAVLWEDPRSPEVYERYRAQVQYADSLLGQLIARLKEKGLYERASIIVTADHGLRRVDPRLKGPVDVHDETTHIPLLIKAPGIQPGVSSVDYQHIDFAATLADVLKVPPALHTGGTSALAAERPVRQRIFYVDQDNVRYWEYVRSGADGTWLQTAAVDGPLRDESVSLAVLDD